MSYYPLFLKVDGKKCLVVGGGKVAERKVLSLVGSGAAVTVVSPRLTTGLKDLLEEGKISHRNKRFSGEDTEGAFLVFAASCTRSVNKRVADIAKAGGTPVNVADDPEECDFLVPSVIERGPLKIAISTSGKSPYLAKYIREELEGVIGSEYARLMDIAGVARIKLLKDKQKEVKLKRLYDSLLTPDTLAWIRQGEESKVDDLLKGLFGKEFTLSALGIDWKK